MVPRHDDPPDDLDNGGDDWRSYRRYVLAALKDIKDTQGTLNRTVNRLETDMSGLKVRIAVMSAIGGGVVVFLGNLLLSVLTKTSHG